jgi:hypothetical protein
MSEGPRITRVRIYQYRTQTQDLGVDYNGFNSVYEPGAQREGQGYAIAIETDQGITGEYAGGDAPTYAQVGLFAPHLLGRDALQRELIYNDVKRALRCLRATLDQVHPVSPGGVGPIAPHHAMRRRGAMATVRAFPC